MLSVILNTVTCSFLVEPVTILLHLWKKASDILSAEFYIVRTLLPQHLLSSSNFWCQKKSVIPWTLWTKSLNKALLLDIFFTSDELPSPYVCKGCGLTVRSGHWWTALGVVAETKWWLLCTGVWDKDWDWLDLITQFVIWCSEGRTDSGTNLSH